MVTPPADKKFGGAAPNDRDQENNTRMVEAIIDFDTGDFHYIRQSGRTSRMTKSNDVEHNI